MQKKILISMFVLLAATVSQAATIVLMVKSESKQTITGFGAACCDGAMNPYGTDTKPVQLLYGRQSKIGLNIMRMEISPSFRGDDNASWSNYNWQGCVPSAKIVKHRLFNIQLLYLTEWQGQRPHPVLRTYIRRGDKYEEDAVHYAHIC